MSSDSLQKSLIVRVAVRVLAAVIVVATMVLPFKNFERLKRTSDLRSMNLVFDGLF